MNRKIGGLSMLLASALARVAAGNRQPDEPALWVRQCRVTRWWVGGLRACYPPQQAALWRRWWRMRRRWAWGRCRLSWPGQSGFARHGPPRDGGAWTLHHLVGHAPAHVEAGVRPRLLQAESAEGRWQTPGVRAARALSALACTAPRW